MMRDEYHVRAAIIAFTAFAECALLVYLTLVTWLMTGWFIDDHAATLMTDADWYTEAASRFAGACLVAAISGAIVYGVNRLVAYVTGHRESRIPRLSALVFAAIIALAGVVAAVEFAIKKPFL